MMVRNRLGWHGVEGHTFDRIPLDRAPLDRHQLDCHPLDCTCSWRSNRTRSTKGHDFATIIPKLRAVRAGIPHHLGTITVLIKISRNRIILRHPRLYPHETLTEKLPTISDFVVHCSGGWLTGLQSNR